MSWFFIALCAPFLLACANHNDKFLLSRYLKQKTIGSIVIFSSLFSGVAIPIVLFIQPDVYDVRLVQGSALVATGMLSVLAAVCYLYALDLDEASFVTPFYQTVPIFAYFLGYFILGETITLAQGLASLVIIVGALALSFEFGRRGMRFKRNVVALMLAASFLSAINGVIFKLIAVEKGFLGFAFLGFRRPGDGRFDLSGLRSQLPQRFPRPLQTTESRRCWPYRVEQDIVQRQRSRHALRDAPGARRVGSSREFVPAPFRLYTRYRADTVSSSRGQGIAGPHEDAAKGRGNWPPVMCAHSGALSAMCWVRLMVCGSPTGMSKAAAIFGHRFVPAEIVAVGDVEGLVRRSAARWRPTARHWQSGRLRHLVDRCHRRRACRGSATAGRAPW